MPKAFAVTDITRHELKTCPDGYVVLKRMTYGQMLQRREMVKMAVALGKGKNTVGEMALANKHVSYLEFSWCIVEHNLEKDDNGTLFNFNNSADVDALDPRIGSEIDSLINEMNNFEDNEELK